MKQEPPLEESFRIAFLAQQFLTGPLTPEEQVELDAWIAKTDSNKVLWAKIASTTIEQMQSNPLRQYDVDAATTAIHRKIKRRKQKLFRVYYPLAAAAAVLLLFVGLGIKYLVTNRSATPEVLVKNIIINDVAPGSTHARLVMGNGHSINLDRNADSTFTQGKSTQIVQQQGTLSFQAKNNNKEVAVFNTLITPKGGDYKLVLEDGTIVWLNAASSIRFPNRFLGKTRSVQVTGEAYFEVAQDPQHPFIVAANGTEVQVLGTAFNIKAYAPTTTYTTLINGAVRVAQPDGSKQSLLPGQMAIVEDGGLSVTNADVEQVTAWKNKETLLRDADIRDIMEELSRWYNVNIQYASDFKGARGITIEISRDVTLSKLLEMITLTKSAKFKLEDNTVTVMSYR